MGGKAGKNLRVLDLAEERVVDLVVNQRYIGRKEFLFFSLPRSADYLEGYIQGIITDYQDNPIQGVVIRAVSATGTPTGDVPMGEGKKQAFESTAFDTGITDANGIYRIRFSLPIVRKRVDVRGMLQYNPGWEQMKVNLGKAYEPQMKESPFHLFFDAKSGILAFSEGIRKVIVQPVEAEGGVKKTQLPGASAPAPAKKEESQGKKKVAEDEDLFKGFGFGQ